RCTYTRHLHDALPICTDCPVSVQHIQPLIHEHIQLGRQDVDIAVEVEELLQEQGELAGEVQAMLFAEFNQIQQDIVHLVFGDIRSEEHTSELQSRENI